MMKLLLDHGANLHIIDKKSGASVFWKACRHLKIDLLKFLLTPNTKFDFDYIMESTEYNEDDSVEEKKMKNRLPYIIEEFCSYESNQGDRLTKAYDCLEYIFLWQEKHHDKYKYKLKITQKAIQLLIEKKSDQILKLVLKQLGARNSSGSSSRKSVYDNETCQRLREFAYNYSIARKMYEFIKRAAGYSNISDKACIECMDLIKEKIKENKDELNWDMVFNQHLFVFTDYRVTRFYLIQQIVVLKCQNNCSLIELMLSLGVLFFVPFLLFFFFVCMFLL